jgi:hypothetical protein
MDVLVPFVLWRDGCLEVDGLPAALCGVLLLPAEGAVLFTALMGAVEALLGAGRCLCTERCLLIAVFGGLFGRGKQVFVACHILVQSGDRIKQAVFKSVRAGCLRCWGV